MRFASCTIHGQSGHDAALQLLQHLYYEETGNPMPPILRTPRGKPYFADSPLHFSITHTPYHAFCVLSDRPIGIDAEELDRFVPRTLAGRILSSSEYAQYTEAEDPNLALLTFWVLKEAQAKYIGTGLLGFPNQTAFSLSDPRVQQMEGCLVAIITDEGDSSHAV